MEAEPSGAEAACGDPGDPGDLVASHGSNPAWRYSERMHQLRLSWGGRCVMCGRPKSNRSRSLEFAHIKPTALRFRGRGLITRFLDIIKHPDCYVLLCKQCHRTLDLGLDLNNEHVVYDDDAVPF